MSLDKGRRRNVWIPDDLWAAVVEAAARETLETGEQINASEFIRRAIRARVEESGE